MERVTALTAHNDVLSIFVYDPLEAGLPQIGPAVVAEAEGQIEIDTDSSGLRRGFAQAFAGAAQPDRRVFAQALDSGAADQGGSRPDRAAARVARTQGRAFRSWSGFAMTGDPADLANLRDIVMPAAIPWWPLAPGIWILVAGLLAAAIVASIRAFRQLPSQCLSARGDPGARRTDRHDGRHAAAQASGDGRLWARERRLPERRCIPGLSRPDGRHERLHLRPRPASSEPCLFERRRPDIRGFRQGRRRCHGDGSASIARGTDSMLTFAYPWLALLLPLPWFVYRFVPPHARAPRRIARALLQDARVPHRAGAGKRHDHGPQGCGPHGGSHRSAGCCRSRR